jgi:hypothetical protein
MAAMLDAYEKSFDVTWKPRIHWNKPYWAKVLKLQTCTEMNSSIKYYKNPTANFDWYIRFWKGKLKIVLNRIKGNYGTSEIRDTFATCLSKTE